MNNCFDISELVQEIKSKIGELSEKYQTMIIERMNQKRKLIKKIANLFIVLSFMEIQTHKHSK